MGYPAETGCVNKHFIESAVASQRLYGDCSGSTVHSNNGLGQGCAVAPCLFYLYFIAVHEVRRNRNADLGVELKFRRDGKSAGAQAARNCQNFMHSDVMFADDVALTSSSRKDATHGLLSFFEVCCLFGLTVPMKKTKLMYIGRGP